MTGRGRGVWGRGRGTGQKTAAAPQPGQAGRSQQQQQLQAYSGYSEQQQQQYPQQQQQGAWQGYEQQSQADQQQPQYQEQAYGYQDQYQQEGGYYQESGYTSAASSSSSRLPNTTPVAAYGAGASYQQAATGVSGIQPSAWGQTAQYTAAHPAPTVGGVEQGSGDGITVAEAQTIASAKYVQDYNQFAQKYKDTHKENYIHGVTRNAPKISTIASKDDIGQLKTKAPKQIPPELIKGYIDGTKNPVSALMEYCAMLRYTARFEECSAGDGSYEFGCMAKIDSDKYPVGTGRTKKDAKTQAAKNAFDVMLGLTRDASGRAMEMPTEVPHSYEDKGYQMQDTEFPSLGGAPANRIQQSAGEVVPATQPEEPQELGVNATHYDHLSKNPISTLQEFCQKKKFAFTIDVNEQPNDEGKFECRVKVNEEVVSVGYGNNKKDSKREAAEKALMQLVNEQRPTSLSPAATLFDRLANLVHCKMYDLVSPYPDFMAGRKVLAGFIMKRGVEDEGTVVALATGNTCITGDRLSMEGRVIYDSHGEIVAKRALRKYLVSEVKTFYEAQGRFEREELLKDCIFCRDQGDSLLRLKDGVSFHLYVSTAPCGDGSLFSPRDQCALNAEELERIHHGDHMPTWGGDSLGKLRAKIEKDATPQGQTDWEGTIPLKESQQAQQTWDGIMRGERLLTMSCSDKILAWNVLGLQGALLSQFVYPIYLTTVTLGYLYDHGHLTRAMCCRVPDAINDHLPPYLFRLNHPIIGRVTSCEPSRELEKLNNLSVNWSLGDSLVEVVDTRIGKSIESSPFRTSESGASRLCKAGFFYRFKELARLADRKDLADIRDYRDAKERNKDYQAAKQTLCSVLGHQGLGQWVAKPHEVDMFTK